MAALERRGVELFAQRDLAAAHHPDLPADFATEGATALIGFNPMICPGAAPGTRYPHPSIDNAVYHLGMILGPARHHLRVAADGRLADRIARALLPQRQLETLQARIAKRRVDIATTDRVIASLSRHKHRAKVELVEWNGRKAVRKTFRATAGRAMENEQAFHDDIAPLSPVPARILRRTDNALYFEYIEPQPHRRVLGRKLPRLLPLTVVRELADFARLVTSRGWDPIDLTPRDNVLIEAGTGALRCIDFEFATRGTEPVPVDQAAFLCGLAPDAPAADMFDAGMRQDPYPGKWRPFTGLSRHSLLHDPAWMQHLKRATLHPPWLIGRALGAPGRRRAHLRERAEILEALALRES
ncbi:hypothetical protein Salmuc_00570 [Salipiger mucosus DSM 16094]|uniref:Uncharacterized protein n=1 Tax=Salipiger mucosus DSM 16094 TaxID=1123237 RepID=S9QZ80_9RHOB|nr:hypothetical protein Salmuc_00570 [Salipiger mucosus DSM 16094]